MTPSRRLDHASSQASQRRAAELPAGRRRDASLTARESEILGLLATGRSGATIAAELVLSPETVRTHVRNAMAKLGASTRSQAVALALQRDEIANPFGDEEHVPPAPGQEGRRARLSTPTASFAAVQDQPPDAADLDRLVGGLIGLHEIDAAAVYLTGEDGMTLRRAALRGEPGMALSTAPEVIALGEGSIGRAALDRRAQLVLLDHVPAAPAPGRSAVVAPIAAGRLVGILCFSVRASRPAGRGELLLVQAFAARLAEVITGNRTGGAPASFATALARFKASWTATTGA